ncbi:MAG: hypothetical protein ACQXXH_04840 [Candidatus Bathyarchaeia archaeon]|nr:hypothetical protein [Candidatus Bathyarchaeota archaeon]
MRSVSLDAATVQHEDLKRLLQTLERNKHDTHLIADAENPSQ